jgi:DNA-binding phage protein
MLPAASQATLSRRNVEKGKPAMPDLHARISRAIAASGRSAREVSLSAGLSPTFLSDMLRRRTDPGVGTLSKVAKALGVPLMSLIEGRNAVTLEIETPEVTPWHAPKRDGQRPDRADRLASLIASLCPAQSRCETFALHRDMPAAGLLAGDVLVLDTRTALAPGDLVVATINEGEAGLRSVIRRHWPPFLIPVGASDPAEMRAIDGHAVRVIGRVCASLRAAALDHAA